MATSFKDPNYVEPGLLWNKEIFVSDFLEDPVVEDVIEASRDAETEYLDLGPLFWNCNGLEFTPIIELPKQNYITTFLKR